MLAAHGLLAGHLLPTREGNCLDHFMLKIEPNRVTAYIAVLNTTVTDHNTIFLALVNNKFKYKNHKSIEVSNYDKAVVALLQKNVYY